MTPQICSFFDDQGFVIDDWHELELAHSVQAGEFVTLIPAGQKYGAVYLVTRIEHTIHVDLDDQPTQIFDVILTAHDFNLSPSTSNSTAGAVLFLDETGKPVKGFQELVLPHCPRVSQLVNYAADGVKTTSKFTVISIAHLLRKTNGAPLQTIVAVLRPYLDDDVPTTSAIL